MSHMKEPWSLDIVQVGKDWLKGRLTEGIVSDDGIVAVCADSQDNALRIVACVNACAGMATEYLESMAGINKPIIVSVSVIKERNELLTTLETVSRNIASSPAKVLEESVAVGDALQRLDRLQQHVVPTIVAQRDELLAAARNLIDVKGRFHSEQAFNALVEAIAKVEAS